MNEQEEPLSGGLTPGRVVRVGDTVRREAGPWTATIFELLAHLQKKNFPSPRPLGLDEQGRESVSYIAGEGSSWPWPPALIAASGAQEAGRMLRRYHDAVADFAPTSPAIWRHGPQEMSGREIVLHGDFGAHNLIWSGGELVGVIDFELARPGAAIEDVAYAALRLAQFRPDELTRAAGFVKPPDRLERLNAFAKGYACSPGWVLANARQALIDELERMLRLGAAGTQPWSTFLQRDLHTRVRLELDWFDANAGAFG